MAARVELRKVQPKRDPQCMTGTCRRGNHCYWENETQKLGRKLPFETFALHIIRCKACEPYQLQDLAEKTSISPFTTGLRHDGHQRVLFVVGAGIVHASLSSRNQWTNAELKQYQHLQVHDENRRVAATAGPIVIPTFVINICRNERFPTSKHVGVEANKKSIAVTSVPTSASHAIRISFWLVLSQLDACRHLLLQRYNCAWRILRNCAYFNGTSVPLNRHYFSIYKFNLQEATKKCLKIKKKKKKIRSCVLFHGSVFVS